VIDIKQKNFLNHELGLPVQRMLNVSQRFADGTDKGEAYTFS